MRVEEKLLDYIKENCDALLKMEKQLTAEQAHELIDRYTYKNVVKQLDKMNDWKGINKKNRSVYLTCIKWFEMDEKRGFIKPIKMIDEEAKEKEDFVRNFLDKYPIDSKFTSRAGIKYVVESSEFIRNLATNAATPIASLRQIMERKND